ncbi:hypothetical protein C8R46DRAFT_1326145 [Mycena filopes]|nr:hypothetical protein C8R46DRAFT_1326145 [Mycena filopes]
MTHQLAAVNLPWPAHNALSRAQFNRVYLWDNFSAGYKRDGIESNSVLVRTWGILVELSSDITDPGLHELCQFVDRLTDLTPFTSHRADIDVREFVSILQVHIDRVRGEADLRFETAVFLLRCALKILPTLLLEILPTLLAAQSQSDRRGHQVAHTVTRILFAFTNPVATSNSAAMSDSGMLDLLQDCFRVLEIYRQFPDPQWILDAIKANLLESMVVCGELFQAVHPSVTKLLEHIASYLVYHSMISATAVALWAIRELMEDPETPPISGVWNEFLGLATRRILLLARFKDKDFLKECENLQCPRPGLRNEHEFKRCSGCMTSVYCSTDCQTIDWRHGGHRDICKAICVDRLVLVKPETRLDRHFLRALVNTDYQALEMEVLAQQFYFMDAHPNVAFVTMFNYTVLPPKIMVLPRAGAPTASLRAHIARTARLPPDTDAGTQQASLIVVIPSGGTNIKYRHFVLRPSAASLAGMQRILGEKEGITPEALAESLAQLTGQSLLKPRVEKPEEVMVTL